MDAIYTPDNQQDGEYAEKGCGRYIDEAARI
jgi:hypothetical protein